MPEVVITYHQEPEGCWADSPNIDGFVVAGVSLDEVRSLVREGLPFYLEQSDVEVLEVMSETSAPPVVVRLEAAFATWPASGATTVGRVERPRTTAAPFNAAGSLGAFACPA